MSTKAPAPIALSQAEQRLASTLSSLRSHREWTGEALAANLETTKSSVSEWETGTRIPSARTLVKYATVFTANQTDLQQLQKQLKNLRADAVTGRQARTTAERRRKGSRNPAAGPTAPADPTNGEIRPKRRGAGGDRPPQVPDHPPEHLAQSAQRRGIPHLSRFQSATAAVGAAFLIAALVCWVAGVFSSQSRWLAPAHAGPGVTLTVDSQSAIGEHQYLEVPPALQLRSQPYASCAGSCLIPNSTSHTGLTYTHAVCEITDGEQDTNGNLSVNGTTQNPHLADSRHWYGIRESGGTLGFVNAVWISAKQRTSVQLRACPQP